MFCHALIRGGQPGNKEELVNVKVGYFPNSTSNFKIHVFHERFLVLLNFLCYIFEIHPPPPKYVWVNLNKFILFLDEQSKMVCIYKCPSK